MAGAERHFYWPALVAALLSTGSAGAETSVERIQTHLERVENELRETPTASLSPEQQVARAENLDRLREYWAAGVFPINLDFPEARTPYFIDTYGTACAVAHLVVASGHRELAERLSAAANNAYLPDIHDAQLDEWIASSGLTPAEHALIQPTYDFYCTDGIQSGDETDVDCGGAYCDPCQDGEGCVMAADCFSADCVEGICEPVGAAGAGGGGASGGTGGAGGTSAAATMGEATATDGATSTGGGGSDTMGTTTTVEGATTGGDMASSRGGAANNTSATDSTSGAVDDEPEAESDAGCSCRTIGSPASPWPAFGLSLFVLLAIVRRR
jgi:MYXO-CTERM domain-containing protein